MESSGSQSTTRQRYVSVGPVNPRPFPPFPDHDDAPHGPSRNPACCSRIVICSAETSGDDPEHFGAELGSLLIPEVMPWLFLHGRLQSGPRWSTQAALRRSTLCCLGTMPGTPGLRHARVCSETRSSASESAAAPSDVEWPIYILIFSLTRVIFGERLFSELLLLLLDVCGMAGMHSRSLLFRSQQEALSCLVDYHTLVLIII